MWPANNRTSDHDLRSVRRHSQTLRRSWEQWRFLYGEILPIPLDTDKSSPNIENKLNKRKHNRKTASFPNLPSQTSL